MCCVCQIVKTRVETLQKLIRAGNSSPRETYTLHLFCFYLSLAALHNDQFLLWGGSGENNLSVVLQDVVKLLCRQILQVSTVNYTGLGISGGNTETLCHFNSFSQTATHPDG